jgi:hypothetical protein
MTDPNQTNEAMLGLINGFRTSQAISVAVRLGVFDHLATGEAAIEDLARATKTDADALYRMLRALAAVGVLHEEPERRFTLTEAAMSLRSDHPGSLAGWAAFISEDSYWRAWGDLEWSIRTGGNSFRHVHGVDNWTWRTEHPAAAAAFDGGMTSLSWHVSDAIIAAFDFGRFATLADIGGGKGAFLAAILRSYPACRGILFDLPHVIEGAADILGSESARCQIIGGSFFDGIPGEADAYIMKSVLHDWEDADCLRILRTARKAMPTGSALLLVERSLGPANQNWEAKFSDLNMPVSPGGRERTAAEYAALMEQCGFTWIGETPSASGRSVFEGRAS